MTKRIVLLCLGAIFLLAFFLRVVDVSKIPNGLHQDELNAGYQGYKILHTGRDLQGNFLPVYINRFGDYRPAGIFYLDGLSTTILGLNTFAIRFPSAIFGALSTIVVCALTLLISRKKSLSLIAAFLVAISPWHIVTSRATSEQIIALFLIIAGVSSLLFAIQKKQVRWIVASGLLLLSSYFFYHTPRVFIPVFLTFFFLYLFSPFSIHKIQQARIKISLITLWGGILLVTFLITLTPFGTGRFSQTSIFGSKDVTSKIQALSDTDHSIVGARIYHNKFAVYAKVFVDQYLSYFSTEFLFIKGGLPDRYVVPDAGLFYYIEMPFLFIGFYFLLRKNDKFFVVPLIWLLVGPLAAALTTEDIPNIQRALFMLPAFQIIEAYGLYYSLALLRQRFLRLTIVAGSIVILLLNMAYFWHQYLVQSPSYISYRRDDGTESLFTALAQKENEYDRLYIPSYQDMPLYYYYYRGSKQAYPTFTQKTIDKGFTVGKYTFLPDECPQRLFSKSMLKREKSLVVDFGTCEQDQAYTTIQTIVRKDGSTAYILKTTK